MPTYDYACTFCGHRFEHFASMTTPALLRCPACEKDGLQRLIGAGAGILFKGSGFYETDYKRPAAAKEGGKPDSAKPDGAKPDAGKSDGNKSDGPRPAAGKSDAAKPSGSPKADAPASTPSPAPSSRDASKPAPKGPRPA